MRIQITGLFFFLLNIIAVTHAGAQKKSYVLNGDMGVQGGELFTYRLELADSSSNYLTGYAYTYVTPGKDVKARVIATLDRAAGTLCIKELEIIYNHGFKSRASVCLVQSTLQLDAAVASLSGTLTTHTAILGAECSKGSITFTRKQELETLFSKVVPVIAAEIPTPSPKPGVNTKIKQGNANLYPPPPPPPVPQRQEELKVTDGKDQVIDWLTDTIRLEIWDQFKVDNDRIQLVYNGEVILEDFSITKERKTILLPVHGNELNIITIKALNEGNEPPNTVNLQLADGDMHYNIVAYNDIGKKAVIRIKKNLKK